MKNVLHIGSERNWRGGENQVWLLANNSSEFKHYMAYPQGAKALERMSEKFTVCELPSSKSYDFRNVRSLRLFCTSNNIDIIDAHSSVALGWALKVKKYIPSIKVVFHRRVAFPMKENIFSRRKYHSSKIDAYVGISQYIVNQLLTYGVDKSKVYRVCSAVNQAEEFTPENEAQAWKAKLNIPMSAKTIGLVGAMTWEKGHDLAIQAFASLKDESFHLLLAGEGSQRIEIENYIERLRLGARVHLLGHIQNVPSLLSALDILVVPSRQEGLGSTVLDAFAYKTFVVASNAGGLPEMVHDGETGLLFQSGDVESLQKKLNVATAKYTEGEIQKNAFQFMQDNFSLEDMVKGNEAVYKKITANN